MNIATVFAGLALAVALVALVVSVTVPEVRQFLGLPNGETQKSSTPEPIVSTPAGKLVAVVNTPTPTISPLAYVAANTSAASASEKSAKSSDKMQSRWTVVTIQNSTSWTINYCINGNCEHSLKPEYQATHSCTLAEIPIEFQASTKGKELERSYDLDGNQYVGKYRDSASGKVYVFQLDDGGNIDLYREE